jgi:hypothetical protein
MSSGQDKVMDSSDRSLRRLADANPVRSIRVDDAQIDALIERVTQSSHSMSTLRRHKGRLAALVGASATVIAAVAMSMGTSSLAPSLALRTTKTFDTGGPVATSSTLPVSAIGSGGKASVFIPAANYVYAVDPLLDSAPLNAPSAVSFTSPMSPDVLNKLVAATGTPTGGSWATQEGSSTYRTETGSSWSLTTETANGLSSFAYESSMTTCDAIPANPPMVNFDSSTATRLSNEFLTALGYNPSDFSDPVEGSSMWQCGFGAQWSFSRFLQVAGITTNIRLCFVYNVPSGSLFSASGYLVTLGNNLPTTPVSALDAATALAASHNDATVSDSSLSTVRVTLGTPSVSLAAYQLADGTLALLPVYDFAANASCSPASAYCTATSLQALGIDAASAASATPLLASVSGVK